MANRNMLKSFLIFFFLCLMNTVNASECYHYHTRATCKLSFVAGKNYLVYTVKDPDGITYVSQHLHTVSNLRTKLTLVAEDEYAIVARDEAFYYLVSKEIPYQKPVKAIKLFAVKTVHKVLNPRLIQVSGVWHYMIPDPDSKKGYREMLLPRLPRDFEIMYQFYRDVDASLLIKTKSTIATMYVMMDYEEQRSNYQVIPGLSPASTVFTPAQDNLDQNFLRDDQHFYLINYDLNFRDVTANFAPEKRSGFYKMQIHYNSFYNPIFTDDSKMLWIYFKDGISLNDGTDPNFYGIEAHFLNHDSTIIAYENRYYANGWAAANTTEELDLGAVKDIASLHTTAEGAYADQF